MFCLQVLQALQEAPGGREELGDLAASSHFGEQAIVRSTVILTRLCCWRDNGHVLIPPQIVHLKRFQFFNGRWVKSQRVVTFPGSLDPMRYTVKNGNGESSENGNGESGIVDQEPNSTRTETEQVEAEVHSQEETKSEDRSRNSQEEAPVDQPASESRNESPDGAAGVQKRSEAEADPSPNPSSYSLFAISVSTVQARGSFRKISKGGQSTSEDILWGACV